MWCFGLNRVEIKTFGKVTPVISNGRDLAAKLRLPGRTGGRVCRARGREGGKTRLHLSEVYVLKHRQVVPAASEVNGALVPAARRHGYREPTAANVSASTKRCP